MSEETQTNQSRDHGEVVSRKRTISWSWVFPVLAVAATAWMFGQHIMSRGPLIEISFLEAPGIEEGKTLLLFRGIRAGEVEEVHLDDKLNRVVVRVRLERFAAPLAVETTDFWIERPVISLQEASGLSSLIQGNSIQARMGSGEPRSKFTGLESSPVLSLDKPSFRILLQTEEEHAIDRGAPVTFRGVTVGRVYTTLLDEEGKPCVSVDIEDHYRGLVSSSSRFWIVPATSLTMGPGGIRVDFWGVDQLVQGAIAFEDFGVQGEALVEGSALPLFANEALAKAGGPDFVVTFPSGRGIYAGQTRLSYLGVAVGVVTGTHIADGRVEVEARFNPAYDFLRRSGTVFTLVEPQISLQGISGLETLIRGVFIECIPLGGGEPGVRFTGVEPELPAQKAERALAGVSIRLLTPGTNVGVGAPVLYRDMQVGMVESKDISRDGRSVELKVGIEQKYAPLVRQNSVFWDEGALRGSIGFLNIRIQSTPLIPSAGIVAFATPDANAPVAKAGTVFTLHAKPRKEWERWDPVIPLP